MTVYTWLVVLLVAAAIVFKGYRKHSTVFLIVAFLLLFAVMGLRDVYAFGSDAWGAGGSYPNIYKTIGATPWDRLVYLDEEYYNVGFAFFTKLIYDLTNGDYQIFISIISLFTMIAYTRFIGKYSPSPLQSMLCFLGLLYYTMLFDVLKQALAMSTLLFSFDAMIEKKPVKFVAITLIAAAFHFPAVVFLPAYWIGRMRLGRKYISLLLFLLLLTYIFRDQLLNLMLSAYRESDVEVSMQGIRFLRNKAVIMIVMAVSAVYLKPPAMKDTLYNALLMFLGVSIIFQTFCGYNNIFERLADYYFHTSIVLIPLILEQGGISASRLDSLKNKRILNYATIAVCAVLAWRFLSTVNNSNLYMPYRFFWQH